MSYSKIGAELGMFSGSELRNYLMQLQLPDGCSHMSSALPTACHQIINNSGHTDSDHAGGAAVDSQLGL